MNEAAEGRKGQQGQGAYDVNLVAQWNILHQGRIGGKGDDPTDPGGNRIQNIIVPEEYIIEAGAGDEDQTSQGD